MDKFSWINESIYIYIYISSLIYFLNVYIYKGTEGNKKRKGVFPVRKKQLCTPWKNLVRPSETDAQRGRLYKLVLYATAKAIAQSITTRLTATVTHNLFYIIKRGVYNYR